MQGTKEVDWTVLERSQDMMVGAGAHSSIRHLICPDLSGIKEASRSEDQGHRRKNEARERGRTPRLQRVRGKARKKE